MRSPERREAIVEAIRSGRPLDLSLDHASLPRGSAAGDHGSPGGDPLERGPPAAVVPAAPGRRAAPHRQRLRRRARRTDARLPGDHARQAGRLAPVGCAPLPVNPLQSGAAPRSLRPRPVWLGAHRDAGLGAAVSSLRPVVPAGGVCPRVPSLEYHRGAALAGRALDTIGGSVAEGSIL
jgi:hypothetical protein